VSGINRAVDTAIWRNCELSLGHVLYSAVTLHKGAGGNVRVSCRIITRQGYVEPFMSVACLLRTSLTVEAKQQLKCVVYAMDVAI
jgi:hypothetical protein